DLLALRARDFHVGLIGAQVGFAAARMKWTATGFANQGLFAKAAFDHVPDVLSATGGRPGDREKSDGSQSDSGAKTRRRQGLPCDFSADFLSEEKQSPSLTLLALKRSGL